MTVNPNGYVSITDGGAPRIITGYAKEIVSGGQFMGASGAAGVVSSGADSFGPTDIEFFHTTGSGNFVGIALFDAVSGAVLSVATRGSFLLPVSGAIILGGTKVTCNNDSELITGSNAGLSVGGHIGRSWSTGSDSDYVIADIHG